jgi:beta-glucosidase-like glycosyl hydrolase
MILTTQFPQPPGMGETWDPELVRQAGWVEGHEARWITQTKQYQRQMLMLWGPQADLARDPLGPQRGSLRRGPILQRNHDDGIRQGP